MLDRCTALKWFRSFWMLCKILCRVNHLMVTLEPRTTCIPGMVSIGNATTNVFRSWSRATMDRHSTFLVCVHKHTRAIGRSRTFIIWSRSKQFTQSSNKSQLPHVLIKMSRLFCNFTNCLLWIFLSNQFLNALKTDRVFETVKGKRVSNRYVGLVKTSILWIQNPHLSVILFRQ